MLHMQVRYLDGILEWLDQQNRDDASALHSIVDLTRIGTAGHSRGAKLACLHFAGSSPCPSTFSPVGASYCHLKLSSVCGRRIPLRRGPIRPFLRYKTSDVSNMHPLQHVKLGVCRE